MVLATWSADYVAGLTAFRHTSPPKSAARSRAAHVWLRTFASAVRRACLDAERYATRIDALSTEWREALGGVRKGSATERLLSVLPGVPVLTVESAARLIDRSKVATGAAVNRLAEAGIVTQRNAGKARYRVFEATAVLDLFTGLERALASPSGDTGSSPPARPAPRRS